LILSFGITDLDKCRGPWTSLLRRHFDLHTGASLTASDRPLVRVTREEPALQRKIASVAKGHDLIKTIAAAQKLAAAGDGEMPKLLRPIAIDYRARRRYSVSRLNGMIQKQEIATAGFDDEESHPYAADDSAVLDALKLGTLVHAVLADLTAGKDDSRPAVASLVRKHATQHLPTSGEDLEEPTNLIIGLTQSPRWASMRSASRLHPELEFLLAWPPEVRQVSNLPHGVFIQGFIDCLYQDLSGDWRLLDYKTNRISSDTLSATVAGYEMQMLVYALAAERVLGRSPVEIVLHFLRGNIEHRFAWSDAARQRVIELVNAGLAKAIEPVS
jgi:ATP-dependent exoDNAse (exonuclease V) beta subunit